MTAADRLRALAAAATPGPWFACSWDPMEWPHVSRAEGEHHPNRDIAQRTRAQDAAYIAALHPAVALAIADLIEAAETVDDRMVADGGGDRWWQAHDALGVALARVEELL